MQASGTLVAGMRLAAHASPLLHHPTLVALSSRRLLSLVLVASLAAAGCDSDDPTDAAYAGSVFVMSNETTNRVVAYARAADGALARVGELGAGDVPTVGAEGMDGF